MNRGRKHLQAVLTVALLAYFAFFIGRIAAKRDIYQWDFKAHYHAAKVHEAGHNIYDRPLLQRYSGAPLSQYYAYTPPAIWFYRLFALMDIKDAYTVFLAFKVLLLCGLFVLWKREFLEEGLGPLFLIFCLLAFNGALTVDFAAGNIVVLEQVCLWLAFMFFLKRRYYLFGLFVVFISLFKLTPLAFLLLLFFAEGKKKYAAFFSSLALFSGIQLAFVIISPEMMRNYLGLLGGVMKDVRGIMNPSTYVLLKNASRWIEAEAGLPIPSFITIGVYGAAAALVAWLSLRAAARLKPEAGSDRGKILVFLACLVFAVTSPRFKDYSYILLLVPAFHALRTYAGEKGFLFLYVLMILTIPANANPPGVLPLSRTLWEFYPLALAYLAWGLYVSSLLGRPKFHPAQVDS